jgi:hypothetical protein
MMMRMMIVRRMRRKRGIFCKLTTLFDKPCALESSSAERKALNSLAEIFWNCMLCYASISFPTSNQSNVTFGTLFLEYTMEWMPLVNIYELMENFQKQKINFLSLSVDD